MTTTEPIRPWLAKYDSYCHDEACYCLILQGDQIGYIKGKGDFLLCRSCSGIEPMREQLLVQARGHGQQVTDEMIASVVREAGARIRRTVLARKLMRDGLSRDQQRRAIDSSIFERKIRQFYPASNEPPNGFQAWLEADL